MLHRSILSGLVLAIPLTLLVAAASEASDTVTLKLPRGDSDAGRAAFLALSCTSCHSVSGEQGFPKPVSANRGPTLGGYHGQQTPAQLAVSIFAPSHEITANVREPRDGDLSPMGDFSEAMTVRQFLDLIAYIRSLDVRGEQSD